MSNELAFQTNIIKSVRRDGGYGRKMSNRFAIGVPDLLIGLQPFPPCYVECKDLGEVVDRFDRTLGVTPKQREEMRLLSEPYEEQGLGPRAFVAVAFKHRGKNIMVLGPWKMERVSHDYEGVSEIWAERQVGLYYPIRPMLNYWLGDQT